MAPWRYSLLLSIFNRKYITLRGSTAPIPAHTLHVMSRRLRSKGEEVFPYEVAERTMRKQLTARGPPMERTTLVHKMKIVERFSRPYLSLDASEAEAEEVGYWGRSRGKQGQPDEAAASFRRANTHLTPKSHSCCTSRNSEPPEQR